MPGQELLCTRKHILWRPKEASGNLLIVQLLLEKLLCSIFLGEITMRAYGRHKVKMLGTGPRETASWAFGCMSLLPPHVFTAGAQALGPSLFQGRRRSM